MNDSSEYISNNSNNGSSYFFRNRHGNRCTRFFFWEKRTEIGENLFYKEIGGNLFSCKPLRFTWKWATYKWFHFHSNTEYLIFSFTFYHSLMLKKYYETQVFYEYDIKFIIISYTFQCFQLGINIALLFE